jgi:hypothetical protein
VRYLQKKHDYTNNHKVFQPPTPRGLVRGLKTAVLPLKPLPPATTIIPLAANDTEIRDADINTKSRTVSETKRITTITCPNILGISY